MTSELPTGSETADRSGPVPGQPGAGRREAASAPSGSTGTAVPRARTPKAETAAQPMPILSRVITVIGDPALSLEAAIAELQAADFEVSTPMQTLATWQQSHDPTQACVLVVAVRNPDDGWWDSLAAAIDGTNVAVVLLCDKVDSAMLRKAGQSPVMAVVPYPCPAAVIVPAVEIAGIRCAQMSFQQAEISRLKDALETRKLVERAKGRLMGSMGLSEAEAFRWIQKTSMDRRLSMKQVADVVLAQVDGPSTGQ